jgi:hypothetical protein
MKTRLYFEAHITCDRESSVIAWPAFCEIAKEGDWKASKFDQDDVDGYHDKWFMSARDTDFESIKKRISATISKLRLADFNVIRWKIEDTIMDSKHGDMLE